MKWRMLVRWAAEKLLEWVGIPKAPEKPRKPRRSSRPLH